MKSAILLALAIAGFAIPTFAQDDHRQPRHEGPTDRPRQGQHNQYSIEQATSDRAQLNTIAFDGLAFLTGDFNCDTFLPPGKISDFFGFQNMRDVDGAAMGHNTDFLTRIANNTLRILNAEQKAQLVELGKSQAPQISELGAETAAADSGVLPQSRGRFSRWQPGLESRGGHEIHVRHF